MLDSPQSHTLPDTAPAMSLGGGIAALIARHGSTRESRGTPLLAGRPELVHTVVEGRLELFLVALKAEAPSGTRHFLATLHPGDLLFGVDGAAALQPVGLMAISVGPTVLATLPVADLRRLCDEPEQAALVSQAVERWVAMLSQAAASTLAEPPAVKRLIAPGQTVEVAGNERVATEDGVGWLSLGQRQGLFLDSADCDEAGPLPVCPATWVAIGQGGAVTCDDTVAVLADGRLWPGLGAFHTVLIDVLPMMLRLQAVDELNRLNRRVEGDARLLRQADAGLSGLVLHARHVSVPDAADQRLATVLRAIAQHMRVVLRVPPASVPGEPPGLDEILRASDLRSRAVVIPHGAWRQDIGPLLVLDGPNGEPAAILRRRTGYVIVGPDGVARKLRPDVARRLGGVGLAFTDALPDQPLSSGQVLRRSWDIAGSEITAGVGLAVTAGLLSLLLPIATGVIVDEAVPTGDVSLLAEIAVILLLIAGVQTVLRLASQRAVLRVQGTAGTRMQAAIMDRVLRLPARFLRQFSAGDLAQRMMVMSGSVDGMTSAAMSLVLGAATFASSLFVMLACSGELSLVAIGLIGMLTTVSVVLGRRRKRLVSGAVPLRAELAGKVLEMMSGIVKLRMAAAENRAFARWVELFVRCTGKAEAARALEGWANGLLGALGTLSLAALFLLIARSGIVETGFGIGALVTFLTAFNQAVGAGVRIASGSMTLLGLKPALAQVSPLLRATPERSRGGIDPGRLSGAVELGAVHFAYGPQEPPVLDGLSLQIKAGEFVAIVGESGSGKSTIARLLLGFEVPQRGAVLFDSKDLRNLNLRAVRAQMGVVLQRGHLVGQSLHENILGANAELGIDAAWRAAEEAGIANDIRAMPMGMHTVVADGGLSGGQLQRVLIARALVHRPRILLLDEATSALDNRTQALVTDSLARLSATRIVIAHRLSTVAAADRIIVVRNGTVSESGTYAELLQAKGGFARLAAREL